jgi:hypothetical protein
MTELRAVMVDDNAVSSPIFQIRKDAYSISSSSSPNNRSEKAFESRLVSTDDVL